MLAPSSYWERPLSAHSAHQPIHPLYIVHCTMLHCSFILHCTRLCVYCITPTLPLHCSHFASTYKLYQISITLKVQYACPKQASITTQHSQKPFTLLTLCTKPYFTPKTTLHLTSLCTRITKTQTGHYHHPMTKHTSNSFSLLTVMIQHTFCPKYINHRDVEPILNVSPIPLM